MSYRSQERPGENRTKDIPGVLGASSSESDSNSMTSPPFSIQGRVRMDEEAIAGDEFISREHDPENGFRSMLHFK